MSKRCHLPLLLLAALPLGCAQEVESLGAADGGSEGTAPDSVDASMPESDECPRARVSVAPGNRLNLRATPSTEGDPLASLPNNLIVDVLDQVDGEEVDGEGRWLQIEAAQTTGFVSALFVECTTEEAPTLQPPDAFRLPIECGTSTRITQGNNGAYSHSGRSRYAYDFGIAQDTPLVAMADGIVLATFAETEPGDPCYAGGGSSCYPFANFVVLAHGDGSASIYKHLNAVLVSEGEFVPSGAAIGLSGSTGYSTGPHAHVMRQENCGEATSCVSIPLTFADVPGDGVPAQGDTVTSDNCP